MNSSVVVNPEIERALERQIEPWLAHMRWRADFDAWREKRLWQENYQQDALTEVARYAPKRNARVLDLDIKPYITYLRGKYGELYEL